MPNNRLIFIFCLFLFSKSIFCQTKHIDSLKKAYRLMQTKDTNAYNLLVKIINEEENQDSTITYLRTLNSFTQKQIVSIKENNQLKNRLVNLSSFAKIQLGQQLLGKGNLEEAISVLITNLKLFDTLIPNQHLGEAYFYLGQAYSVNEQRSNAIQYYLKAINVFKILKDYGSLAGSYSDLANIYLDEGNLKLAISTCFDCIKICEKNNLQFNSIQALRTLSIIYNNQNEIERAQKIALKALNLSYQYKSETYQAQLLHLLGYITAENNEQEAINYYHKSLVISTRLNNLFIKSYTINNLGGIYSKNGQPDSALKYYQESLKIQNQLNQTAGMVIALTNIGKIYNQKNNTIRALKFLNEAYNLAIENNNAINLMKVANILYQTHKNNHNFTESLKFYELYIKLNDSINNSNNANLLIKSELKYEYEKKAAADSIKVNEEKKISYLKLKQEKTQKNYLYIGLATITLFGIFIFNRFLVTKKQKSIIEEQKKVVEKQKELVDEKQKEIIDSIKYAKRIQQALLPKDHYISRNISNQ